MIFKGSRYEKTGISYVTGPKGQAIPVFNIRFIPPTPAGYLHTFRGGERLDTLAYNFYKNGEKFWLIADANDEMDPEDLMEPGRQLLIPPDRT